MKKDSEKQPIDNLFARRLGKMSLPPSPDGFERLQQRMESDKPAVRIGLWRNQTTQRYMTAAACLLFLCLFGWLYWHSDAQTTSERRQIATNHSLPEHPQKPAENQPGQSDAAVSNEQQQSGQVALVDRTAAAGRKKPAKSQVDGTHTSVLSLQSSSIVHGETALTQANPVLAKADLEDTRVQSTPQVDHSATEQVATNSAPIKPSAVAERVLIVTIEEPASLVAARQRARDYVEEKAALTATDKAGKEAKGSVWQHVKRFKEGELFARHSEENTDERGLLDRAYSGLKHSFDKNKPAKQ